MRSRSSNIYSQLAAEDAAHCIQVQDLDHLLMGSRLPSRDSVVLGIEWQSGWYLPHESLVLLVREGPQSNGGQGIWWIRLARFLGHDFITPHRNVHPVQRPRIVVRAEMDMGSTGRLVFGHVVQVVDSLRRTMSHYSDLKMDSWFYAATIFKLLASQGLPTPAGIEKRLMYEDHPTANRVQREQFQEIFNRVERLLEAESWSRSHVEAPEPPGPSLQLSVPYKLGRRAGRYTRPIRIIPISGWERLKSQLDSSKPDPEELSKTVAICDETEKNSQT
ncbi:hypothetical protein FRC09_002850 [Ceratobasidium sp. 395]|nr:hypothetical protein FRC09_002850 [Ceratobasidium sp. 395]